MTLLWFIIWLIVNTFSSHQPLLFDPGQCVDRYAHPCHRAGPGERPRTDRATPEVGTAGSADAPRPVDRRPPLRWRR